MPLHDLEIAVQLEWRWTPPYIAEEDWGFASPQMQGKRQPWAQLLHAFLELGLQRIAHHFTDVPSPGVFSKADEAPAT